ncbi:hypothetical protein [Rugosimonospora acidiphila]|uniref:hypothetical protein n=1 Tax=Rugosimonospora acidiphila TaxID=556531 RepID=UPI0031E4EA40
MAGVITGRQNSHPVIARWRTNAEHMANAFSRRWPAFGNNVPAIPSGEDRNIALDVRRTWFAR